SLMGELESFASRGYTEVFVRPHVNSEYQNYEYGVSKSDRQLFWGEVLDVVERDGQSLLEIDVKNKFCLGDSIEIMTPAGNVTLKLSEMQDHHDKPVECALGSGWRVRIPNPFKDLDVETLKFGLVMRNEAWGGDLKRDAAARDKKKASEQAAKETAKV
ncbi:MAG: U32 family peptidase C-terminal domain-containing protein, partial [Hydrogenovibrio crunogenus]|nr:U32 family peptidase C-terminal domain-containing protein [Hydrogenovibrio crunogenus]